MYTQFTMSIKILDINLTKSFVVFDKLNIILKMIQNVAAHSERELFKRFIDFIGQRSYKPSSRSNIQ